MSLLIRQNLYTERVKPAILHLPLFSAYFLRCTQLRTRFLRKVAKWQKSVRVILAQMTRSVYTGCSQVCHFRWFAILPLFFKYFYFVKKIIIYSKLKFFFGKWQIIFWQNDTYCVHSKIVVQCTISFIFYTHGIQSLL